MAPSPAVNSVVVPAKLVAEPAPRTVTAFAPSPEVATEAPFNVVEPPPEVTTPGDCAPVVAAVPPMTVVIPPVEVKMAGTFSPTVVIVEFVRFATPPEADCFPGPLYTPMALRFSSLS